jgi:Peptidase family S41/Tricorn protease C1 domain
MTCASRFSTLVTRGLRRSVQLGCQNALLLATLSACAQEPAARSAARSERTDPGADAAPSDTIMPSNALPVVQDGDAVWSTDGYGQLIHFKDDSLIRYEVTAVSCIRAGSATKSYTSNAGDTIVYESPVSSGDFGGVADVFRYTGDDLTGARWLAADGAISRVRLRSSGTKPPRCDVTADRSPITSYNVFWQTFREHYLFFALRGVDWDTVDRTMRPRVNAQTTPSQLLAIFREMLEPLHDAHTFIDAASIRDGFGGRRASVEEPQPGDSARIARLLRAEYVRDGFALFCNGRIEFGMLKNQIAFIRVHSFESYAKSPQFLDQRLALEQTLDTIFKDAQAWRGLIIDVRINGGGSDVFGNIIAGRLTRVAYKAYDKVVRNDTTLIDKRSLPQAAMVQPTQRPSFLGAVVLLTGNESVSAAETFSMALMERQPRVTRVGEPTQGVFSDVLVRSLPNDWKFGLPNEVYLTKDGRSFDGPGVPPDITIPVFRRADLQRSRDIVLERAHQLLSTAPQ